MAATAHRRSFLLAALLSLAAGAAVTTSHEVPDRAADTGVSVAGAPAPGAPAAELPVPPGPGARWPLWFEPAAGAGDAFVAHGTGYHATLHRDGADVLVGSGGEASRLALRFEGGAAVAPSPEQRLPGVSHHFLGSDPAAWRRDVPHYSGVRYPGVYPGIDAIFYGAADDGGAARLEYDFVVAPGADPRAIALRFEGGAALHVDEAGRLVAGVGDHAFVLRAPVAYQWAGSERVPVDVRFELRNEIVRFRVGEYDSARPLTIDPVVVVFGTFIGGEASEFVEFAAENGGIAVDAAGSVYVAGDTTSTSVVPGGPTSTAGKPDVFVVKINAAGSAVQYATFIGGNGEDARARLALAPDGSVYVVGRTRSADFPVTAGALKATPPANALNDAFIVRLNPGGSLAYGTYFGGSGDDYAESVTLRGTTLALAGSTTSTNLPVTGNAAQPSLGGNFDAWLAVLDVTATPSLTYCTYAGGTSRDGAFAVAIDSSGRIVVGGLTQSTNFPTTVNALQKVLRGTTDAFVARFVPSTGARDYSTLFGGTSTLPSSGEPNESATRVAVDASGAVVIAGISNSTDLPAGMAPNPVQPNRAGGFDAFVAKLAPDAPAAQQLLYRTYLGGTFNDAALALDLDTAGRVYLAGYTLSANFPQVKSLQTFAGFEDGFVSVLSADGTRLEFSTLLGGSDSDVVLAIDHVPGKGVYLLGTSYSTAPVPMLSEGGGAPIDGVRSGTTDGFVARLDVPLISAIVPASGTTAGSLPITIAGTDFAAGATVTIGGAMASIMSVSTNAIVALTPPGTAGARDIVVTNPTGASDVLAGGFTYVTPSGTAPTLASVAPSAGTKVGGTGVVLTGTNFVNGASVFFGAQAATGVVVLGPTTIAAVTPAHPAGAVNVAVVNPDLQAASNAAAFTYLADADGDGMDDQWEIDNGLDPNNPGDADADPDDDGASNRKEYEDGTDPRVAVTRYFAEGASDQTFTTRFALLNADATRTATVRFDFLITAGPEVTITRTIPPMRRLTLDASNEVPELKVAAFSTSIRTNLPVAADRTMTWDGTTYGSHAEVAVASPAATWYLAEGATTDGKQLFYLIQNPNNVSVDVTIRYLLQGAQSVQATYTVGPKTRETIWVNYQTVQGVSLNQQQLSAVLTASPATPIIVERAMYLDAVGQSWGAGHESAGITQPATRWFLAEGDTGFFDQFVLIANPNNQAANITAQFLLADGSAPVQVNVPVGPNTRETMWVNYAHPSLAGKALSTVVTSDVPVIVERAMWWPNLTMAGVWYEAHNSAGATATAKKWLLAEGEMGALNVLDTYVLVANTSNRAGSARIRLVFEDSTAAVVKDVPLAPNSRKTIRVGAADFDPDNAIGGAALVGKRFGVVVESTGTNPVDLVVERAMYWTNGGLFWSAGSNALGTPVP